MRFAMSLLNFRPGLIGGTETYLRQFIAHLPAALGSDRMTLVMYRDIADAIALPAGVDRVVLDRSSRQIVLARLMEAFTPLRSLAAERVFHQVAPDAIFFPQQSIFPKAMPYPSVLTVVDLQHLFFPEYFSLGDKLLRATIYPRSLRQADRVVAISEFTRRTVIEKCAADPGKITAVPFGQMQPDLSKVQPADDLPRLYLYYPAATFPHKNHVTLLRTFAALKNRGGWPYKLVLTGKQTEHWAALRKLIDELGLAGDVVHPGFIAYDKVMGIFQGASAIVFPTRFEGFGLPVVEAVAFGKKTITSRLEVFDEIGVPRRWQIDFARPDELAAALSQEGPTVLERPLSTWTQNVSRTLDLLREAASERKRR